MAAYFIEHWFTRPADVLANGLALLAASATLANANAQLPAEQIDLGRVLVAAYAIVILVVALIAMVGRSEGGLAGLIAPTATSIAGFAGQARVGWSLFLALVLLAGHAREQEDLWLIAGAWAVVVLVRPVDWLAVQFANWVPPTPRHPEITIEEVVDPRMVVGRAANPTLVAIGDEVEWPENVFGHVVDRTELLGQPRLLIALDKAGSRPRGIGHVTRSRSAAIGYVSEGTKINELVARCGSLLQGEMSEGRLLSAPINGTDTLFQVTAATTDERVEWGVRRQVVQVRARKLGIWNETDRGFDQVPWLPDAGAEVRLVDVAKDPGRGLGVGLLPGTAFSIGIQIEPAVLYNTAILGILGVGKTSLAVELVQRMLSAGIMVVVIDITGEYAMFFEDVWSPDVERAMLARLESALAPNRANQRPPREQAGNSSGFKPAFADVLDSMKASGSRLLIINPSSVDLTAEDGFPNGGVVPLRHLTNVEVTRLVSEALLDFARRNWPADPRQKLRPQICLVLEEAHSLVPEGTSTADDKDKSATTGTSRAVLQGRKFGLGCLLITQRTANVTKTILNQCHTVFAMRSFDTTSEAFLSNYLGSDYAALLPSLKDRQAVLFGRGSTSQAPVMISTNDRDQFRHEFWDERKSNVPTTDLTRTQPPALGEPQQGQETMDELIAVAEEPPFPDQPPGWFDDDGGEQGDYPSGAGR